MKFKTGAEERRIPLDLLKELVPFVASQDVFQVKQILLKIFKARTVLQRLSIKVESKYQNILF